jgi:acyl-homoserine-lactone acylase
MISSKNNNQQQKKILACSVRCWKVITLLIFIGGVALGFFNCMKKLPTKSIADQVIIRRDTFGIPHIFGENEEAAAFGFGYAQAEDHLMTIARRLIRGRGEEAKYFGPIGISNDFAMKQFNNLEEAQKGLELVGPSFRAVLRGYAAGLNAYIAANRDRLPDWLPSFTDADILANIRARSVRALMPPHIARALEKKYSSDMSEDTYSLLGTDLDKFPVSFGSNAIVFGGTRTTSGSPILLANPHLRWASLYWEAHITVPGVLDFFGNTLVGYPVLWAGFNKNLGWANTVNRADLDDLFALRLDPDIPDHYIFEGISRKLKKKTSSVEVAQKEGGSTIMQKDVWDSHLGPIVYRTDDQAFAVRSTRLDAHRHFEGFYELAKAQTLDQFMHTMRKTPTFTCNFIYADVEGNILYLWNAQIPQRIDDGMDYSLDVPGDTDRYVWSSTHSLKDLPCLLNPPGGVLQNANNSPWYPSRRDQIDPTNYPTYFERPHLALRPQLALDLMEQQRQFSVNDVISLKFGTRMLVAERVLPDLLEALRHVERPSDEILFGIKTLEDWDHQVSAQSRGAVLFERFWNTYQEALPQPFAVPWSEDNPFGTPRGLADPGTAVNHLEKAVRWTRDRYGSENIAWGDIHRFRHKGIDLPAEGADGSYGTFRVMRYEEQDDGSRVAGVLASDSKPVGGGDGWIMLVHFKKPLRAWSVLAYGQTTSWDSDYSSEQLELFATHKLRPVWFTAEEIADHTLITYYPGLQTNK